MYPPFLHELALQAFCEQEYWTFAFVILLPPWREKNLHKIIQRQILVFDVDKPDASLRSAGQP
jgi:hypothetical protein